MLTETSTLAQRLELSQRQWESEFPVDTAFLAALRDSLIEADCNHLQSRAAFHALNTFLESAGQPMYLWPASLLKHFEALKRRARSDDRHFTHALLTLQTTLAAHQASAAKIAAEAPPPAPEPGSIYHEQMVFVRVVDGRVITEIPRPAAFWCNKKLWTKPNILFTRRYFFSHNVVPPEYAYVLTDEDETHPPGRVFALTYTGLEFARLCQLELDTNSPCLIDGERYMYEPGEQNSDL